MATLRFRGNVGGDIRDAMMSVEGCGRREEVLEV
eukprot:CAMPEP_0118633916 /NCGR_PEP_ID=MMETSP0785-20121206/1255_1 /TAXON_ID=91992 /ORGANISM="Bolidomonas pacifica, Strain CCMP 1866" /LENGTH=33 /DNA_ID= /DNA_START= /DNA_END= /DNA_ORIENTATION=